MVLGQIIYFFISSFHDPLSKHNNMAQSLAPSRLRRRLDERQLHFHLLPEEVKPWDSTLPSRKADPVIRSAHSSGNL